MANYTNGLHGLALALFAIAFIMYAVGLGWADSALVFGLVAEAGAWLTLFLATFLGKN